MANPLAGLDAAIVALHEVWADASGSESSVEGLSENVLVAVNEALGAVKRHTDAVHARVAAEIARQSRRELGPDGLAKKQGFRNPTALIATTTGTTSGEAIRLVRVGEATAPRMTFTGEAAPAKHPHVAAGIDAAMIGTAAASAIITMLDRVSLRAGWDAIDEVERLLVEQAKGLSLDQLAKIIARAEAYLDPDGVEPKEHELRAQRTLHMFERDGMLHLTAKLDPETAAPVKTAIEAIVSAEFRAGRDERGTGPAGNCTDPDQPERTLPQRQADALAMLARHGIDCDREDVPTGGAVIIVRMNLSDLETGSGHATIDGLTQPISIGAARRLAADARIIPCVLGTDSEILDWGREKRLFTKAQKRALTERDGGCAMCGLPPGMTRVHHLRWWKRDHGPTDLSCGVLLCESCHHRIHDNGWEVEIEGTKRSSRVWFIPPAHVDPARTRRLGGRARFDYLAA